KREFGRPLIEAVLPLVDLTLIVDTSQAYIPYHGTPTVLMFGRNQKPERDVIHAVLGKRGEGAIPNDPAHGKVLASVADAWSRRGENEYVSVADLPRATFAKHPWSLTGGGAAELLTQLGTAAPAQLSELASVGGGGRSSADELFVRQLKDW